MAEKCPDILLELMDHYCEASRALEKCVKRMRRPDCMLAVAHLTTAIKKLEEAGEAECIRDLEELKKSLESMKDIAERMM